jgi:hypothetical protein
MSANVEILKSFLLSRERQGFSIPVQARIYLYYFLDSSFRWNDNILDVNSLFELL